MVGERGSFAVVSVRVLFIRANSSGRIATAEMRRTQRKLPSRRLCVDRVSAVSLGLVFWLALRRAASFAKTSASSAFSGVELDGGLAMRRLFVSNLQKQFPPIHPIKDQPQHKEQRRA